MSAKLILDSQEKHQIDLIGPVHVDPSWQSRTPGAFDASQSFKSIGKRNQQSVRKGGRVSAGSHKRIVKGNLLRAEGRHQALQGARERQQSDDFNSLYRKRSGIKGTLSQAIRSSDLRRARYVGQAKTLLQNLAIAVATNIKRLNDWLNEIPLASTRHSRFTLLLLPA